ncbi:hypothetical protein D3C86_1123170 [compost metagenome]
MLHFLRREELGFLDVDHGARFGHRDHEVGLARQEGRQLDDVADFSDDRGLIRLVDVGDDRHAEGLLDVLEDAHAFFQARTTIGGHRRPVGLVETGLEHVRDTELFGDLHILFANLHGHVTAFQHVHAAEQHHGFVVGNLDVADADDLLCHRGYAFFWC